MMSPTGSAIATSTRPPSYDGVGGKGTGPPPERPLLGQRAVSGPLVRGDLDRPLVAASVSAYTCPTEGEFLSSAEGGPLAVSRRWRIGINGPPGLTQGVDSLLPTTRVCMRLITSHGVTGMHASACVLQAMNNPEGGTMNASIRPMDLHPQQFQFREQIWEYHPQLDYRARLFAKMLVLHAPIGEDSLFDLKTVSPTGWVEVQDNTGAQVPLSVYVVDPTVVLGRWTLVPGIATRQPDFMEQALHQLFPG